MISRIDCDYRLNLILTIVICLFLQKIVIAQTTQEKSEFLQHIQVSIENTLRDFPESDKLKEIKNQQVRLFLTQMRRLLVDANRASSNWNFEHAAVFANSINVLSSALSVGYNYGVVDGGGEITEETTQVDDEGAADCSGWKILAEKASSCAFSCKYERSYCLCIDQCKEGWPCLCCFECNLAHAVCYADCIFVLPPPDEPRIPTFQRGSEQFKEVEKDTLKR